MPGVVAPIVGAMSSYGAPWALCGGWAVDAWLGRATREHGDVDISVFVQDQQVLFEHLRHGWQLVPHGQQWAGGQNRLWEGEPLDLPGHFHGRIDGGEPVPDGSLWPEQGWVLDIQLDAREGGEWVLSREPRISVPLPDAVRPCAWGVPAVVPEVLLFFKAKDLRRRDKLDFAALAPHLSAETRAWLRDAIASLGHPWVVELA